MPASLVGCANALELAPEPALCSLRRVTRPPSTPVRARDAPGGDPVARVLLEHPVPIRFHGQWVQAG